MEDKEFKALWVTEEGDKSYKRQVVQRLVSQLPPGELLVRVLYSSLNYKDALSASGNRGVTRRYPHTPGIDCAGVVEQSTVTDFAPGEEVIVSCFDLGMNTPGGFGQYIRVPAQWAVKLPEGMNPRRSMIYGTAGFTAAQCVERIISHGVVPQDGPVLVTGATGGVGCMAVAMLAASGYTVSAASGKDEDEFLTAIGAAEVIKRQKIAVGANRAMLRERWAAAVDTVGGPYLEAILKTCRYSGIVTCCGNVAAPELNLTVYPFILRGITLAGIDSALTPVLKRQRIWQRIAGEWNFDFLEDMAVEVTLNDLSEAIDRMLAGHLKGRVIVKLAD
ncbi:MAG TPA: acryloyl-CoA reductase [Desulfobacterales bacterium]|nr:acryloyl-CoA reductase [Desulfobacterales bacterium]